MSSNVLEFCGLTEEAIGMELEHDVDTTPRFVVSEEARQIFTAEEIVLRRELAQRWFDNFPKKRRACMGESNSKFARRSVATCWTRLRAIFEICRICDHHWLFANYCKTQAFSRAIDACRLTLIWSKGGLSIKVHQMGSLLGVDLPKGLYWQQISTSCNKHPAGENGWTTELFLAIQIWSCLEANFEMLCTCRYN